MIFEKIIAEAVKHGASDIHLKIREIPKLRIATGIINAPGFVKLTEADMYETYDYIILGNVELDTKFRTERNIDVSLEVKGVRLRVNLSNSEGLPILTARIVKDELPKFEELGLPEQIREMAYLPQGLILVTGKTNSGKSTTLNCIIDDLNKNTNKKIITLEDPIEYMHKSDKSFIVQKEVGEGKDIRTFSEGVRNSLREDPDVVVVGEIRDRETIDAAIEIAESGHLVIATLHTRSCTETIDRIINFYDLSVQQNIKFLLSSILRLIVSQRLVPIDINKYVMVPEVMIMNKKIASVIRKPVYVSAEVEDAIQAAGDGSQTFTDALAKLVLENKLSLEEAKGQLDERGQDTLVKTVVQMKRYGNQA